MGFKIGLPRIFDGGLECQHQHPLCAQLLGKLISGEGLAETHLRVPEEMRNGVGVLLPAGMGIGVGLFDGPHLFLARREILVVRPAPRRARGQTHEPHHPCRGFAALFSRPPQAGGAHRIRLIRCFGPYGVRMSRNQRNGLYPHHPHRGGRRIGIRDKDFWRRVPEVTGRFSAKLRNLWRVIHNDVRVGAWLRWPARPIRRAGE